MQTKGCFGIAITIISVVALAVMATSSVFATPATWNDPNFQTVWNQTDKAVQDRTSNRSWTWGPETIPGSPAVEPYAEAPGGYRTVQYFDKSRMEVNNPGGDRSQLWFVTNGLLAREMVMGKIQTGNATYVDSTPSTEAVAGDPADVNPNCPTYASFKDIATLNNDHPSTLKSGTVNEFINKAGQITTGTAPDQTVHYGYFDQNLKHNIPNVFWTFMNQSPGLSYWTFVVGLPITEPYWTKANVAGVERDVLVQVFERRVLTYNPANSPEFKVEMGNVGQHYYRWRYLSATPTPTPTATATATPTATPQPAEQRIAFVSDRGGSPQIYTMKTDGGDLKQLTSSAGGNWNPRWSPNNSKIVFSSTRDGNSEIYTMNADGTNQKRLTSDPGQDMWPSWSPDGSRIIWSKNGDIYSMAKNGSDVQQITSGGQFDGSPFYSPDGTRITYFSDGPGNQEVYTADLDGSNAVRLTYRANTFDYPTGWNGSKILFSSIEGAVSQVWSMNADGGSQTKLAGDKAANASYSPDGGKIVYENNGEIYVMNSDGTQKTNITNATGSDVQPDWSN